MGVGQRTPEKRPLSASPRTSGQGSSSINRRRPYRLQRARSGSLKSTWPTRSLQETDGPCKHVLPSHRDRRKTARGARPLHLCLPSSGFYHRTGLEYKYT